MEEKNRKIKKNGNDDREVITYDGEEEGNSEKMKYEKEDGERKKNTKKRKLEVDEMEEEGCEKVRKKYKKVKRDREAVENEDASSGKGSHTRGEEGMNLEGNGGKKKHKEKKRKKKKSQDDLGAELEEIGGNESKKDDSVPEDTKGVNLTDGHKKEKRKKRKKKKTESIKNGLEGTDDEMEDGKKKKKKKTKSVKNNLEGTDQEMGDGSKKKRKTKSPKNYAKGTAHETEDGRKKKTKKTKSAKNDAKGTDHETEDGSKKKKSKLENNGAGTSDLPQDDKPRKKRVSFSGSVEVFPTEGGRKKAKKKNHPDGALVQGKRFSPEEDAILEQAIQDYIDEHNLGEDGRDMIRDMKNHPQVKGCWKEIQMALPHRTRDSIYYRGHILLERGERVWTPEEREMVVKFHEEHGPQWKKLATQLGKYRFHVKDAYRRYKLPNAKKGRWSQDEYQKLFDLVNKDIQMKASEERKSKHGMLRDNICWGAISDKLETRITTSCCLKWYGQLSSPMVADGIWKDTDDYHLLDALYNLDACCMEDVDWDNLLEHRSGDICRKRWTQMVKHIGEHANKPFSDQVEVLSQRYCPDLLEAREAYANRPAFD